LESFLKNFLEPFSYFIYATALFIKLGRDKTFEKKVLFIYYLCSTFLLFVASFLVIYTAADIENNWLYNIFYLITICILSYYFYKILNNKIKKYVIIFLLVINVILFVFYDIISGLFYYVFYDIISGLFYHGFNEYVYAICFISIVVYALLYFDQLLRNVNEHNILYEFNFWLVSGYLLYFLGCFIIILFYRSVNVDERGSIWSLQNIILFLSSVVTLTGYLRIPSKKLY
jgi:hypothetical protein